MLPDRSREDPAHETALRKAARRSPWAVLLLASLAGCGRDATAATKDQQPAAASAFCGEGFRALDETTCLALPATFTPPRSVIFFAHGILAPGAVPPEQAALRAAANDQGFAVIVQRGRTGLCDWDPKLEQSFCWPTKQETVDRETAGIVAAFAKAQERAEEIAGGRFQRRYLVGFSNGGYFAAHVAVGGLWPLDGAAVVGAGRTAVDESRMASSRVPLYIAVGDQEAGVTKSDAATLAGVLKRREWPVQHVVHSGRGHELRADDLAAAWAAWGR